VHATTLKAGRSLRLNITETLDEYLAGLTGLIEAVNQMDNVRLMIRPHPVCDLSNEELLGLLPSCARMTIYREGSFSEVLAKADLLVSYSSTCIEEALQNNIPVVLFDLWKRYNHFQRYFERFSSLPS